MSNAARWLLFLFCIASGRSTAHAETAPWITEALRAVPLINFQPVAPAAPAETSAEQDPALATPHPSVARIIVPEHDGTTYGSGTLVDVRGEYGLVVTNWHVVEHAGKELWVEFSDGFRSAGKLLKVDRDWDLAAIAIWRPNAGAVALAHIAPRPGDRLVIAGYGNGPFRAARGECLQYVTPSLELPLEMVQVTASARNGDSGGPIFNDRGELAGVLFGTGEGVTSGSYCGRVNQFLASVLPKPLAGEENEPTDASTPKTSSDGWIAPAIAAAPSPITVNAAAKAPPATVQDFGLSVAATPPSVDLVEPDAIEESPDVAQAHREAREDGSRARESSTPEVKQSPMPDASRSAPVSEDVPHTEIDWLSLAGATTPERLKTALAILGLCTLIWHTVRLAGGARASTATPSG